MIPLLLGAALAAEGEGSAWRRLADHSSLHGDLKSFFLGTFPYDLALLPNEPYGQAVMDGRLKLAVKSDEGLRFELHHALTASVGQASSLGGAGAGVGLDAPEAVDLSWTGASGGLSVKGRVDRLVLSDRAPSVSFSLGRQPVSFGTGLFFTPLDLVNPFSPTTVDNEYKPGVDALRLDLYRGQSARLTTVAAYAGGWDLDGLVLAAAGQATVGVTDLLVFLGEVHDDEVFGLGAASSVGPVGLHGEATLTLPDDDADPFVRAVAGADYRPTGTTSLSGELYAQSWGQSDPDDYLLAYLDPRVARGELWAVGQVYAAVAVGQELTPLVQSSLAVIANLGDPSALVAPSLSWSVANNASLSAGAYLGLGPRPELAVLNGIAIPDLQSEFGAVPVTVFVSMGSYF